MSLKENIDLVKQELNSEEKIFESTVKVEYFVKKYRKPLITTAVAFALFVGANAVYKAYETQRVGSANEIFLELLKDQNSTKKDDLKSIDPALYEAYMLFQAVSSNDQATLEILKSSQSRVIADVATYQKAVLSKDVKLLDNYAYMQDAIYKDLAVVSSAIILIKENRIKEAKEKLKSIPLESPIYKLSRLLLHYKV